MKTIQPHRFADRPILTLVMTLLCISAVNCAAQDFTSRYNLKKVSIGLMDGTVFHGTLLNITSDSLAIQNVSVLPPGTILYVRFRAPNKTAICEVKEVTKTGLILSTVDNPETFRCNWNDLKAHSVKRCPLKGRELVQFQRQWFAAQSIRYISMRKKGSGGLGALAGLGAGAIIGGAIGSSSKDSPQAHQSGGFLSGANFEPIDSGTGGAILGGLIGLPVGVAIGSSKKKMMIDGDPARFKLAWEKIVK